MTFGYDKEYCQPFTLIFFNKKHDPLSKFIEFNTKRCLPNLKDTKKIWTHVGIVITKEVCKTINLNKRIVELVDNEPYLWESTISNKSFIFNALDKLPDVETNKNHFGVQLRRLSDVMNTALNCGIDIAYTCDYCSLVKTPNIDVIKLQFRKLKHPHNLFKIYSHHEDQIETSASTKMGTVFSSQFITMVLISIGAISNVDCKTMLPHELAYPSLSDNEYFADQYGEMIKITEINSEKKYDNAIMSLLTSALIYSFNIVYKSAIKLAMREIIERIPVNNEVKKQINDMVNL